MIFRNGGSYWALMVYIALQKARFVYFPCVFVGGLAFFLQSELLKMYFVQNFLGNLSFGVVFGTF